MCRLRPLETSPKKNERSWRSIDRAEDLVQEKCESDSLSLSQDSFTPVRSNRCSDWDAKRFQCARGSDSSYNYSLDEVFA